MLDAALRVNNENLTALPNRIKLFKKEWKTLAAESRRHRDYVEKEYEERKPTIAKKKRQILRISPFVVILSVLLFMPGFQPPFAAWTIIFVVIAVIIQAFYWLYIS